MRPEKGIITDTRSLAIGYTDGRKEYRVLDNIEVSARAGELVAVIGRNGTGKSTLLRTIAALHPALSGNVRIFGKNIGDLPAGDLPRIVTYTSVEPVAVSNMSVFAMAALGRFPYTNWLGSLTDADREAVMNALKASDIVELAERSCDNLSDGERQRAVIARSLAQDTSLLIMDEPTAFLDLPSRYSIVSILRRLTRDRHKCVIYSTHDLDTAINEADKIWLVSSDGVTEGAPEDLILSGAIAEAFESPLLSFSRTAGTFTFVREREMPVSLEASGLIRKLTEKALVRNGYRIEGAAEVKITVPEQKGTFSWNVSGTGDPVTLNSIYELAGYLADLPRNQ